jgi:hypothetical protein
VLRDAVAHLNGHVSKVVIKKDSKENEINRSTNSRVRRNRGQCEGYDDQREFVASARRPQQLELRSGERRNLLRPYTNFCMRPVDGEPGCVSGNATPFRLPVTPISASVARKRPRYYESPLPTYEHQSQYSNMTTNTYPGAHPSQYSNMTTNTTPTGVVFSPPQRPQIRRPSSHAYYSGHHQFSANNSSSPASGLGSHFVPPSGQMHHPWVADVPPFAASAGEFDLFNGELLSDHSDREGAISPIMRPQRGSSF